MAVPVVDLKVLDTSHYTKELDLASELFHRINRIIPEGQKILTVQPTERAREAIALMQKHGYSQVPVVSGGEVLGVFSYRSFAREAATTTLEYWNKQRCAPGDLYVDEFIEQFKFARITEEMDVVFDALDQDNGVLIGTPERLVGILTPTDVLRYLHHVASPFVWLSEIETTIRKLIRVALNEEQIAEAAKRVSTGDQQIVPTSLEKMTFGNYQTLLSHGENWLLFEPVFGGNRILVSAKLKRIADIRNDVFHFKRLLNTEDYRTLWNHREWLRTKVRNASPLRKLEALS